MPLLVGFLDNVNGDVELLKQVLTVLDLVIAKMKDHEGLKNLILKRQGEGEKHSLDSLLIALQQVSHVRGVGTAREEEEEEKGMAKEGDRIEGMRGRKRGNPKKGIQTRLLVGTAFCMCYTFHRDCTTAFVSSVLFIALAFIAVAQPRL